MSFKTELSKTAADVEKILDGMIPGDDLENSPSNVSRYAILDAGKRLRTFLTVQVAGLFGANYEAALRAGACVEMVHNFSLIHDDLPCIDNDVLRRGRASVWAKYGESNAVLAGDFLLNRPYKILATDDRITTDPARRIELIEILSDMTAGMIQGEWMDIVAEREKSHASGDVQKIQELKTGCLFNACTMMGGVLGDATDDQRAALRRFTDAFGLCFQVTDDILDATGTDEQIGKTAGKDAAANKATFVSLLGLEGARAYARELADQAKGALSIFDERADTLRELMDWMVVRKS